MDILNLELMPCKQTYESTFKYTIQVHELAPPTCVLKILIDPFLLSYLSHMSYIKISLCFTPFMIFLPLFHYLCYYLCLSPPLSSMTTKVLNIDSITCRVEIINVNQWGEDYFPKFGLV